MYTKHSIKTLVVIGFLLISTMGLLFPSVSAYPEKDEDDGIWTDDFTYENQGEVDGNLSYTNCKVDFENSTVLLNKTTEGLVYDFKRDDHNAYKYQSFFFFPNVFIFAPRLHFIFEEGFDQDFELPNIKELNEPDVDEDEQYAITTSTSINIYVVHRFKFDLDSDAETLGNVHVRWYGKGIDTDTLKLYYWKYFTDNRLLGIWEYLDRNETNDTDVELNYMIIEEDLELALTDDGEFQICVVATSSEKPFTLMTDYVNVTSLNQDSYKTDTATIETKNPITPGIDNFYWEIFTWNDYECGEATVKYQIYCNTSEGDTLDTLIEDQYISGNSEGLTNPPINLYLVPSSYNKLKIKATLDTDNPSVSPKIFSWTVTWQKGTNKWQDNFNSSHRIAVKTRIKIEDNVSINPISGDWPMFGQNPQNTRTSEGKGPSDRNSTKLYWWDKAHEDSDETVTVSDPVISDEYLYISSRNGTLYRYDYILDNEDQQGDKLDEGKIKIYDGFHENEKKRDIIAPPAITNEYIVVVTGETDNDGTENFVYVITKDDSSSFSFDYEDNISYWSPPIVSDDKVFVTTWSGDPDLLQSNENNKLLVLTLDIDSGSLTKEWEFDLPFHSFSAPAVSDEFVVVGCTEKSEDNLFALDKETGELIWSASVGTIGKSSPVIYNNTVFVVSEKSIAELERTKVTAFRLDNGTVIWEKIIGIPMSLERILSGYPYVTMADSTPAIYDEKLYVACPGGNVVALYTRNGTKAWSQNIYLKSLLGTDILDSSPAIADDKIYISTPSGELYSLDIANDGEKKVLRHTYPSEDGIPFVTSPIVSNGLVFVVAGEGSGTIGNHRFYCCGSYEEPTEQINGHLISIPIELPTGKRWKNFYADFNASDDGNDIVFSILDANKKHIMTINNDGDLTDLGERALERVIRLRANLSADNISVNPELAYWSVTFYTDNDPPDFVEDSFTPNPGGWIIIPAPTCTIDVWDNISGLNLGSAYYEIGYSENNTTLKTYEEPAKYTGVNGTKFTTLTANISALDFADNITKLDSITFRIKDYANNIGSITIDIKQDNTKPTSNVTSETDGGEFNDDYVVINAIASDPSGDDAASDIASVSLYYRYSDDNTSWSDWTEFGDTATSAPFTWNFTDVKHGGYYELYSIATDEAENVEDAPDSGDVSFILDNEPPDMPDLSGQHWFKELPEISIEFSDDFILNSIEYKPKSETEWKQIKSNINKATYDSEWTLAQEFWDEMNSGTEYILEFRIKDTLDNTRIIEDDDGYKIYKDESRPYVDLEIPTLETEWSFENTFTISAFATDGNGSGIKSVELFYRYSEDGDFDDVNWSSYGDGGITSEPSFEWEFTAAEGNGYYEFYVRAEDLAGNVAESEVFSTGINIFPIFSVIAMVILIIALILITIVIIIKWRKK